MPASRVFIFAFLLCLPLPRPASSSDDAVGKWIVVTGRVTATTIGAAAPRPARAGDSLKVGDLVETGEDGRAQALLADNSVVNLSSGTSLRILQYSWDVAGDRRTAVVKLLGGKARFIVPARKESRFSIETAEASATAGAADFVVRSAPGETLVAVLDGNVRVKNISEFIVEKIDVRANQTTTVARKIAPAYPAALPPQDRKAYRQDARYF